MSDDADPFRFTERPLIEVRFLVEERPTVTLIAFTEADENRVWQWLESRPDLKQLIEWIAEYSDCGIRTINQIIVEDVARHIEDAA
jgi:hypothetical protein